MVRQLQFLAIGDVDLNKGIDNKICKKIQKPSSEASMCPRSPYNKLLNPFFKKMLFEVLEKGYLNTELICV